NPPNVLITNYAMLEHLLLLPRNRGLFENGELDLQFLILDEIHTYRGAQASDVSMLLRKLLLRYGNKHTQCIGTSASLSNDEIFGRRPEDFAEELFSRKFTRTITGTRLVHSSLRDACPSVDWSAREWVLLKQKIETFGKEEVLTETVLNSISNCPQIGKSEIEKILFENLPKIKSFVELSTTLHSKQTVLLRGLMNIFPCDKEQDVLSALHAMVSLGAIARNSSGEFPLLPAKYHFFIGNIQGVYVSFNSSGEIKELHLEEPFDGEKYYSIKTCRSCGSLYIELFCNGRKAYSSRKTLGGSLLSRKTYLLDSDEEVIYYSQSEDENDNGEKRKVKRWSFKPATGDLKEDETPLEGEISLGEVEMQKEKTVAGEETNNWVVKTCPICGSSDSDEIVTSFCPGDFAYSEVITDCLYEALPESLNNENKPGNGRKLLVFNDNRQDCAYFAPVHQDRHQRIIFLNRLLNIIAQKSPDVLLRQEYEKLKSIFPDVPFEAFAKLYGGNPSDGLPIASISRRLLKRELDFIVGMTPDFSKKPSEEKDTELQAQILAEIAIPGNVRSGLIGKGLIKVEYANLTDATVEPLCNKLGIEKGKARALFKWFLYEILIRRAVSMPDGVLSDNKEVWGNYAQKDRFYSLNQYQCDSFSIITA
ncbi:MAG: hypothetical protein IJX22_02635, partial [Opitutales bacterium]|nr:hypothetical protein [Opitutales bacterium]